MGPDVLNERLIKVLINLMLEIELRNLKFAENFFLFLFLEKNKRSGSKGKISREFFFVINSL